ncbi:MAG: exodeoxyribonuclease III [Pseudomonadota bacterium]
MRVLTLNLNGIRSAARKGFFAWLDSVDADFVCLQEVRAQTDQITDSLYWPAAFHCVYHSPERKGYSGVAIFAKRTPSKIIRTIGHPVIDDEARWLEFRFPKLSIVSLYLPSGSSGQPRQDLKMDCLGFLTDHLAALARRRSPTIICGDFNIAHTVNDIRNWRSNQKNSGFLPEERAWLDQTFDRRRWVDSFRELEQPEHSYTWWSNRGQAYANNVGWRLDYQIVSRSLRDRVTRTHIHTEPRFSDHAPYIVDYDTEPPQ